MARWSTTLERGFGLNELLGCRELELAYTVQVFHKRTHAVLFELEDVYWDSLPEIIRNLGKSLA